MNVFHAMLFPKHPIAAGGAAARGRWFGLSVGIITLSCAPSTRTPRDPQRSSIGSLIWQVHPRLAIPAFCLPPTSYLLLRTSYFLQVHHRHHHPRIRPPQVYLY